MGRKIGEAIACIAVCCATLLGCVKDRPTASDSDPKTTAGVVHIVCEGNFGSGEATLYAYNPTTGKVWGDVYKTANNASLGDVFQSMNRIGGNYYLCINNSDIVAVIDTGTHKLVKNITIPKPRYILQVGTDKAYISTLYSNKLYVLNTQSLEVMGTIALPTKNPEGMILYLEQTIVTSWDTAAQCVYKVNVHTDKITQAITIAGYAPVAVLEDKHHMLWVLSGNREKGRPAAFTRIDPSTGAILAAYHFDKAIDPIKPVFNRSKDTLYFIEANYYGGTDHNGIYKMGIEAQRLPEAPFIAAQKYQYFWGLGIDPATSNIYVGDPKGFIQQGSVYIYRPDGRLLSSFLVGQGPGFFYF